MSKVDTAPEKSDLNKFVELYKSVGVELEIEENKNGFFLKLEPGYDDKIVGYTMFFSEIHFDEVGKFISQGIWE